MNEPLSDRYREINRANLNKPVSQLVCPRCESRNVWHDREEHDHPGIFDCKECGETFTA